MDDQFRNLHRRILADKKHPMERYYPYKLREESIPREHRLKLSEMLAEKAKHLCREGDFHTAIAYCTISIIMDPNNAEISNLRGILRYNEGDIGGALDDFESALRINHDFADAHANMALAFEKIGKLDEALECIDCAIYIDRNNSEFHETKGQLYYESGDPISAIREFTIAMRITPDIASPYMNRGLIKKEEGDIEGAIMDLRMAELLVQKPVHPDIHFNLGLLYLKAKDMVLAMHSFDMAIKTNPYFAEAYRERANLKFDEGDIEGGAKDMERCLELSNPGKIFISAFPSVHEYEIGDAVSNGRFESEHYKYALECLKDGRIDDSVSMIDGYICMLRTRVESSIILKKAIEFRNRKDYSTSINLFSKAIEFDSEDRITYYERGSTKALANDHKGAALDFTTAINMGFRTSDIYTKRGNSYLALSEYGKAAEDFEAALKIEKTPNLFYLRGYALYMVGNYSEAHDCFVSSIAMNGDDHNTLYHISLCKYELGDITEALKACENAILLDKARDAKYFMHSGLLREIIQDYDGAIQDYTVALKLDPSNAKAYERRSGARFAKGDIAGYLQDEQEAKRNEDQF